MSAYIQLVLLLIVSLGVAHSIVAWRLKKTPHSLLLQNLGARASSLWVLLGLGVPLMSTPEPYGQIFLVAIMLMAWKEFVTQAPILASRRIWWSGCGLLALQSAAMLWHPGTTELSQMLPTVILPSLILSIALIARSFKKSKRRESWLWSSTGILFTLLLPAYGLTLLVQPSRLHLGVGILVIMTAQLSDVLQYICGKLWGKTPLTTLSPHKTWEGLLGGIFLATLLASMSHMWFGYTWQHTLSICFMSACTGFLGGLFSSYCKRKLHIKDWGTTLRGHGGILDRIDSIVFSLPLIWLTTQAAQALPI